MAIKLPYLVSVGLIPKVFEKIQIAKRPERFTQDFLETKLGHSGGSARALIPLLKRLGFLASDGSPTSLYDQYRNSETQGAAVAEGMKHAFSELFDRNEYVYELPRDKLTSLVIEITGAAKGESTTKKIVSTFAALNEMADFDQDLRKSDSQERIQEELASAVRIPGEANSIPTNSVDGQVDFRVAYTVNLNLPETSDPDVFNAIFKALKENLLRN